MEGVAEIDHSLQQNSGRYQRKTFSHFLPLHILSHFHFLDINLIS